MLNIAVAQDALLLVKKLAACGMLLTSLEYLWAREVLNDGGTMSWPVGSLRHMHRPGGFLRAALNELLKYPNVCGILVVRAILALAILAGVNQPLLALGISLLTILFLIRSPYGHDGADQMLLIIFIGLSLISLSDTHLTRATLLWFLSFQVCLAYSVSGFAKLSAKGWRDGSYLIAICGTSIYGNVSMAKLLRSRPRLARVVAVSLILWECSFPLTLFAPIQASYAFIATGLVFHLVNAYFMGLNTFVYAFVATYPALLFCVQTRRFWY